MELWPQRSGKHKKARYVRTGKCWASSARQIKTHSLLSDQSNQGLFSGFGFCGFLSASHRADWWPEDCLCTLDYPVIWCSVVKNVDISMSIDAGVFKYTIQSCFWLLIRAVRYGRKKPITIFLNNITIFFLLDSINHKAPCISLLSLLCCIVINPIYLKINEFFPNRAIQELTLSWWLFIKRVWHAARERALSL